MATKLPPHEYLPTLRDLFESVRSFTKHEPVFPTGEVDEKNNPLDGIIPAWDPGVSQVCFNRDRFIQADGSIVDDKDEMLKLAARLVATIVKL
ncbi:hypothetical protein KA005_51785 [bacterium]|nr:hypothetical protein [bacterium]